MVFGVECRQSWIICVALYEVASIFPMLQHCLQSTWFGRGAQKFTTVRTLLRLDGSSPRILLEQMHFVMSTIIASVNIGRLVAVQMQWLSLAKSLSFILMLLLTFVMSDVVMVVTTSTSLAIRG